MSELIQSAYVNAIRNFHSTTSPGEHARKIVALCIVLDALVKTMDGIRKEDGRIHHTATAGHLRSALSYEQKVLASFMDPQGMMALTNEALEKLTAQTPREACALLIEGTPNEETQGPGQDALREA